MVVIEHQTVLSIPSTCVFLAVFNYNMRPTSIRVVEPLTHNLAVFKRIRRMNCIFKFLTLSHINIFVELMNSVLSIMMALSKSRSVVLIFLALVAVCEDSSKWCGMLYILNGIVVKQICIITIRTGYQIILHKMRITIKVFALA